MSGIEKNTGETDGSFLRKNIYIYYVLKMDLGGRVQYLQAQLFPVCPLTPLTAGGAGGGVGRGKYKIYS